MRASQVRLRLRIEIVLAILSALTAAVTLIWPNWIEILFEAEPDRGDGSLEWAIFMAFVLGAVIFSVLARLDFRRLAKNA